MGGGKRGWGTGKNFPIVHGREDQKVPALDVSRRVDVMGSGGGRNHLGGGLRERGLTCVRKALGGGTENFQKKKILLRTF